MPTCTNESLRHRHFDGNPSGKSCLRRAHRECALADQAVPIVAVEELIRGRLNVIRQAEAGKARITIEQAYLLFEQTLNDIRELRIISYTTQAELLLREWRKKKIRGATHDLRIASICVASSNTLVTRNRRDFQGIPGLMVEFWE
jgi:tRNA(fMet)-specific endonuclease VapC